MTEDNHFISKILLGEKWAEKSLYERHQQRWFRLCLRYGKNRMEAMDMLQEGLIEVFKDLNQFDSKRGTFVHWSNRVMVNAALRFLKKNQWQQNFTDLEEVENEAEVSEDALDKIAAKELIQLIHQLPLGYRIVFNMYVIEGFSHQEIANYLNITTGTSKSQLSKAKKALRKKLEYYLNNG